MTVLHGGSSPVAPGTYLDWHAQAHAFEDLAAAEAWGGSLAGGDVPEAISGVRVTANLLRLLGAAPVMGRGFTPEEDQPGKERVLLLSHALWQRRFGGDPGVVGQAVRLDGVPFRVIGVMPEGFQFPPFWFTRAEMWAPLPLAVRAADRGGQSLRVFGRLRREAGIARAQSEIDAICARLAAEYPRTNARLTAEVVPLKDKVVGNIRPTLLVLLGTTGLVLLIGCANVANLLLARAASRRKEMALRVAVGAGRGRLVRQLVAESVVLAVLGGAAGFLLAEWGTRLLIQSLPGGAMPRQGELGMDTAAFAFAFVVSLVAGALAGLVPAIEASRADLNETLKEGGRGSAASGRQASRSALVIAEMALAIVLLAGASLTARSFIRLQTQDPGFNPHDLLTFTVRVSGTVDDEPLRKPRFFEQVSRRLETLPGVRAVGAINHVPLAGDYWTRSFRIEGRPAPEPGEAPGAAYRLVRPGYFRAMEIPMLRGRDFSSEDAPGSPCVAIVNDRLTQRHFPGEDPVGRRIAFENPEPAWCSIVGVVRDVKQSDWTAEPGNEIYLVYDQAVASGGAGARQGYLSFVVRTASEPLALVPAVRAAIRRLNAGAAVSEVETMDTVIREKSRRQRLAAALLACFAVLALLLAGIGIYGVVAWTVAARRHDIGIRMALGAAPGRMIWLTVGQAMGPVAVGIVAGVAGALAGGRFIAGILFQVRPADPATFLLVPLLLALVALAACWLPARRAARVDPTTALREL